jgi:hypothetical protein
MDRECGAEREKKSMSNEKERQRKKIVCWRLELSFE